MGFAWVLPSDRDLPGQLTIADTPAHRGGEGDVYTTMDGEFVVKVYQRASPDKRKLLEQVISLGGNLGQDEQFLAWPLAIVTQTDKGSCLGVVMRRAPPSHVPLYRLIYSPLDAAEQFRLGRSWLDYVKIARGTAAAVRAIHGKGMAHADIHLKNFLGDPVSGQVVLVDLDGVVVRGFLPPQVKGMPGFMAPEVVMGRSSPGELTDRHSVAVLVLWILLLRNVMVPQTCHDDMDPVHDDELGYGEYACFSENPRDRRNWIPRIGVPLFRSGLLSYRALTPKLQGLAERALIEGLHDPPRRPQVVEWEQALAEAYDVVVSCSSCRQSWLYSYWVQPPRRRQCPFCGSGMQPPFPAVVALLEERARGSYVPARPMVLYHGLPLFGDTAEPGRLPPFTRQGSPILGQAVWDAREGIMRLVNRSDVAWKTIDGSAQTIRPGTSVPLRPGTLLSFGQGRRAVRVIE